MTDHNLHAVRWARGKDEHTRWHETGDGSWTTCRRLIGGWQKMKAAVEQGERDLVDCRQCLARKKFREGTQL